MKPENFVITGNSEYQKRIIHIYDEFRRQSKKRKTHMKTFNDYKSYA